MCFEFDLSVPKLSMFDLFKNSLCEFTWNLSFEVTTQYFKIREYNLCMNEIFVIMPYFLISRWFLLQKSNNK